MRQALETREYALFLEPLDVLRFGDGRPSAIVERSDTLLPTPQPVTGALLTALLTYLDADFDKIADGLRRGLMLERAVESSLQESLREPFSCTVVRGPWLARRRRSGEIEVFVPAPHDLFWREHRGRRRLVRAQPIYSYKEWFKEPTDQDFAYHPVRGAGKVQPCREYITLEGLARYLRDEEVSEEHLVRPEDLYRLDTRVGTAIDPATASSAHGLLYARQYLSFRPGVGLYVSLTTAAEKALDDAVRSLKLLPLGGGRRYVRVHLLERAIAWSDIEPTDLPDGFVPLMLFTTPTFVLDEQLGLVPDLGLGARFVRETLAISGWNYALRAPKPTRLAAAAGAVYFTPDAIRPLLPNPLHSSPDERFSGWGCWLRGRRRLILLEPPREEGDDQENTTEEKGS